MSPETGLIHPSGITVGDARLLAVYSCACPPLFPASTESSPMTDTPDRDERHLARMLRKKAVIDERIANSPNECGLLLVLTGNGKGKSSSAFGMLARSMGHGMQCGVVQFIKGRNSTGGAGAFSCDGRGLHLGNPGSPA
jgi:hypothetical protein